MRAWISIAALLLQACSWVVVTESVKGRAFVIKTAPFASTYWNCDATKGDPVCYKTRKLDAMASLPPQSAEVAPEPPPSAKEDVPKPAEETPKAPPAKKKGKK